jgi:predicted phage baseplate assembly protein
MPLTLPNLDDRRWADLVEESRALIPVYGSEWTDHNVHDPGITLVELLAYLAELDLFELNQVPDAHKRRFLALLGLRAEPTQPARTFLKVVLAATASSLDLPAGVAFTTRPAGPLEFQTARSVTLQGGELSGIQAQSAAGFADLSQAWRKGEIISILGNDPRTGDAFYLGFSAPLGVGKEFSLYLGFAGEQSSCLERQRIQEELCAREWDCSSSKPPNPCRKTPPPAADPGTHDPQEQDLLHQSVRTVWEFLADTGNGGSWQALDSQSAPLEDETRGLTLSGGVRFTLRGPMLSAALGAIPQSLFYVRCRFVNGMFDARPALRGILSNAVAAVERSPQCAPLRIAPGALLPATPPKPGDRIRPSLQLDSVSRITELTLHAGDPAYPEFLVLDFRAPGTSEGSLLLEAVFLGKTSGFPLDQFDLPKAPVVSKHFRLFVENSAGWVEWERREDFEASSFGDKHFVLSSRSAQVQFGDGRNGLVPDAGSLVFAVGDTTEAEAGNAAANAIVQLEDSLHNRAVLQSNWEGVRKSLSAVTNPFGALGGQQEESLDLASLRAIALYQAPSRAISRNDYEQLALSAPGVRLARAFAIPDFHDHFPCCKAPGLVTVVIVPYLPDGKPFPSAGSRNAVLSYLNRRRILATRIRVVGPRYAAVSLKVTVKAIRGVNPAHLVRDITNRLKEFLDPLKGGEDGNGWPFGRHVYRADVLSVIAQVTGVDHVLNFSFIGDGCSEPCNEICIAPTGLAFAGTLQVEVA